MATDILEALRARASAVLTMINEPHFSSNPAAVSAVHEGLLLTGINRNRNMDK